MKPYGLIADLHLHNWQAFSSTNEGGVNLRLLGLLNEFARCCKEVVAAGGDTVFIAGDVFHVRGSIAPSVLNPTLDVFRSAINDGMKVIIIPGNHDLEGKHSTRLGSAITALEGVGAQVCHSPTGFTENNVMVIPWVDGVKNLREILDSIDSKGIGTIDLLLHAPIDGVIAGLPDHGLAPSYLAGLGFRRVFAGHYHHHKDFGNSVYSVGALAHHTWSDVHSKAGFLVVSDSGVRWMKSHLPEFVDITGDMDEGEAAIQAEGNYVRIKTSSTKTADIEMLRDFFTKAGAKGVIIQSIKAPTAARDTKVAASVHAGASLETSVAEFIKGQSELPDADKVLLMCQEILAEAGV